MSMDFGPSEVNRYDFSLQSSALPLFDVKTEGKTIKKMKFWHLAYISTGQHGSGLSYSSSEVSRYRVLQFKQTSLGTNK